MTQQVIDSMNFHDRRAKGIYAKFEKTYKENCMADSRSEPQREPLSPLTAKLNIQQQQPLFSRSLPEPILFLSEERIFYKSGSGTNHSQRQTPNHQSDDRAMKKSFQERSDTVWLNSYIDNERKAIQELSPPQDSGNKVKERPKTVAGRSQPEHPQREQRLIKSAGRSMNRDTLYKFVRDKNLEGVRTNVKFCTTLIKEQWKSTNRQYVKTGVYKRGKSKDTVDKEDLQWFSFEGNSPGALQAFTKAEGTGREPAPYSIEAGVGASVANRLANKTPVNIGRNGRLTSSTSADPTCDFLLKCEEVLQMTSSSGAHSLEPDQPPLCIKDLYKYARIIQSSQPKKPAEITKDAAETLPVIYNDPLRPQSYVQSQYVSDEPIVQKLLQRPTSPQKKSANTEPPSYQDILRQRAPASSAMTHRARPMDSLIHRVVVTPREERTPSRATSRNISTSHSYRDQIPRTPVVPEDLRSQIPRQCTMPSYNFAEQEDRIMMQQRQNDTADRVATPMRPPHYVANYKAGSPTPPTIAYSGPDGPKEFVKINTPLTRQHQGGISANPRIPTPGELRLRAPGDANWQPSKQTTADLDIHWQLDRPNTVLAGDISSVALVGKSMTTNRPVSVPAQQIDTEQETHESEVQITIPMMETASASSAAHNSIDDFLETDSITQEVVEKTNLIKIPS